MVCIIMNIMLSTFTTPHMLYMSQWSQYEATSNMLMIRSKGMLRDCGSAYELSEL